MHEVGCIHNDLKLDNFLVGLNDASTIYLIDFGLSSTYITPEGTHMEKKQNKFFSGNFMFSSLNAIYKSSTSRRDDIESLFYVMIYLLNEGKLPWSNFGKRLKVRSLKFKDMLRERTKAQYSEEVLMMCPQPLREIMKKVMILGFTIEPPYDEIIEATKKLILFELNIGSDLGVAHH